MARIELWNGDICDLEVDAIVSPASTSLWMSTGVAGELKRVGGDEIEFAAVRQAPVELGDAIVTPAGRLAAKVVIHAVSLERDRRTSAPAIDTAARSAMARVRELGLTSVAFPALGTGIGGLPARARPRRSRSTRCATSSARRRPSSTSSSRCAARPPTRRSPSRSARACLRRRGRCSSPRRGARRSGAPGEGAATRAGAAAPAEVRRGRGRRQATEAAA